MKRILFAIAIIFSTAIQAVPQSTVSLFYVATAVDSNGDESAFSNQTQANVSAAHNVVDLSWAASSGCGSVSCTISGYNVYRSKVSGSGYVKINSTLISGTTYTDTYPFPSAPSSLTNTVP